MILNVWGDCSLFSVDLVAPNTPPPQKKKKKKKRNRKKKKKNCAVVWKMRSQYSKITLAAYGLLKNQKNIAHHQTSKFKTVHEIQTAHKCLISQNLMKIMA